MVMVEEFNIKITSNIEKLKYFASKAAIHSGVVCGTVLPIYVTDGCRRLYDTPSYTITLDEDEPIITEVEN